MYYTHIDHLGSLRVVTTPAKAIQTRYIYDAWGSRTTVAGTSITNRGFTGHEHLPEFGFINMNARLYDPVLGRFLAMDNYVQMPDYTQAYNRYTYAMNNPLIYVDEDGEFWHIVIGAVVGGAINWISHGCKFTAEGLTYFGVGVVSGALTAAVPGAYAFIAAGTSAANSVLQQGYATDWQNIDGGKVIFDGMIGGLTSYASGLLGEVISPYISKLFGGIKSPLLREILSSQIVGVPLGGLYGGLSTISDQEAHFWEGVWGGMKMGFVTSTLSGIGNATRYSIDNKVGLLTGEKRHGHHSNPMFMGGDSKQKLTGMNASRHQQLHRDLDHFLFQQQDAAGNHMRSQKNNPGRKIQDTFTPQQRQDAMKSFYDANKWRYPGARYDYYRNTGLRWWIW
jgi:RHS repeat-associated protein